MNGLEMLRLSWYTGHRYLRDGTSEYRPLRRLQLRRVPINMDLVSLYSTFWTVQWRWSWNSSRCPGINRIQPWHYPPCIRFQCVKYGTGVPTGLSSTKRDSGLRLIFGRGRRKAAVGSFTGFRFTLSRDSWLGEADYSPNCPGSPIFAAKHSTMRRRDASVATSFNWTLGSLNQQP